MRAVTYPCETRVMVNASLVGFSHTGWLILLLGVWLSSLYVHALILFRFYTNYGLPLRNRSPPGQTENGFCPKGRLRTRTYTFCALPMCRLSNGTSFKWRFEREPWGRFLIYVVTNFHVFQRPHSFLHAFDAITIYQTIFCRLNLFMHPLLYAPTIPRHSFEYRTVVWPPRPAIANLDLDSNELFIMYNELLRFQYDIVALKTIF